jgi:hypothetical protein
VLSTSDVHALIKTDSEMQQFNMQLSFKQQSFTGMLIVQRKADSEIRIVAATYFGPTLFDFGLKNGEFVVYNCIKPLRNKNLIKLFENDFKQLFLPNRKFRKIKEYEAYEERVSGWNFGKTVFFMYKNIERFVIKHSWIGTTIQLDKLMG